MSNRITPEYIQDLKSNEYFVFGSNMAGRHGAGAARLAFLKFGAIGGQAKGLQGKSYAIPTLTANFQKRTMVKIQADVYQFIMFAKKNPEKIFLTTQIGCGLAHFTIEQIAPMFKDALQITNIHLPLSFIKHLI